LGLRLREINDLLAVRDTGRCPCEPAETLLRRRIGEIDAGLARLSALRAELVAMADRLPGPDCPDPAPGGVPLAPISRGEVIPWPRRRGLRLRMRQLRRVLLQQRLLLTGGSVPARRQRALTKPGVGPSDRPGQLAQCVGDAGLPPGVGGPDGFAVG
jgi:hypothetical protein